MRSGIGQIVTEGASAVWLTGRMSSVRFKGGAKEAHQVLRDHPELYEAIHEGIYKHGLLWCTR